MVRRSSLASGSVFSLLLTLAVLITSGPPAVAAAGDGATSNIDLLDTNADGYINRITFDIANPNGETWVLDGAAPYGLSVTQGGNAITISSVAITTAATANPVSIQVDLDVADVDMVQTTDGVGSNAFELIYTQVGGGAACTNCLNDSTDEELNAIATGDTGATDTETDAAAPVITDFAYQDADLDAFIDRFVVSFSETVTAASVISANDLSLTNDGDFDGAAFGADATDLVTGSVSSVNVDLGTPATEADTGDTSGTLAISTQNAFSLTDGTNTNTTLGAQTQADFTDDAAPHIESLLYRDASLGGDGLVDSWQLILSEPAVAASVLSLDNLSVTNDGDFDGLDFVSSATDLITSTFSGGFLGATASTVVDTFDDSGNLTVELVGTFNLTDAVGNSNTQVEIGGAIPSTSLEDDAAPMIKELRYKDVDGDGKIDTVTLVFSETLAANSLVRANDLVFDDVGDFTGMAFGTDTTDLVMGAVSSIDVTLGTEATVVDTSEDSGDIDINGQNAFALRDALNLSGTTFDGTYTEYNDYAAPVIASVSPTDGSTNASKSANIVVTFSEAMDTTFAEGTEYSVTPDPGSFVVSFSSSDKVATINPDVNLACDTAYNVVLDELEIDAAAGSPTQLSTAGPADGDWTFTTDCTSSGSSTPPAPVVSTTPEIDLTAPVSGSLTAGSSANVSWTEAGVGIETVKLEYSLDGGATWSLIADDIDDAASPYAWAVPMVSSTNAVVKITGQDSGKGYLDTDMSGVLTIASSATEQEEPTVSEEDAAAGITVDAEGRRWAPGSGVMSTSPFNGATEEISVVQAGWYVRGEHYDTVYYIPGDGTRLPFWDATTFMTWADSWDEIVWVTDTTLQSLTLGSPMLPQPGVVLVKVTSDPNTYHVEYDPSGGDYLLRHIASETIASSVFGTRWADYVIDVDPAMMPRYGLGTAMTSEEAIDISDLETRAEIAAQVAGL